MFKKTFYLSIGLLTVALILEVSYSILGVDILGGIPILNNFLIYLRGLSEYMKILTTCILTIVLFILLKWPSRYIQDQFEQGIDRSGVSPYITVFLYSLGGILLMLSVTLLPHVIHPKYVGICRALGYILIISSLLILRKR